MLARIAGALCLLAALAGAGLVGYGLHPQTTDEGRPERPAALAPPRAAPVVEGEAPTPRARSARLGDPLATIRIPALGTEWTYPVIEGIRDEDLDRGVSHYPGTPMPGEPGNVALAAHRWEGPFYYFERLSPGDLVYIETATGTLTYRIETEPVIIEPTDVWVVDPLPGHMLTLTTCWPKDGSSHREYVRARLIPRDPS